MVYIGSTVSPLYKRMTQHKAPSNDASSKSIVEAGDAYIELLEDFPCERREQLNKREGELIRATANCVNKMIAGRTKKQYLSENVNKIKAYVEAHKPIAKEIRDARLEICHATNKAYRLANKDILSTKRKARRHVLSQALLLAENDGP